jgi:hypothetical protein
MAASKAASKATFMVGRRLSHIQCALALVLMAGGVAHASEPDRVSLGESTTTWSTVKYLTDAENGFIDGSLDMKTIVEHTFKTHVLENRYLKVTLVPEFGGRILPSSTSRPATRSFIARKSACPTG